MLVEFLDTLKPSAQPQSPSAVFKDGEYVIFSPGIIIPEVDVLECSGCLVKPFQPSPLLPQGCPHDIVRVNENLVNIIGGTLEGVPLQCSGCNVIFQDSVSIC